MLETATSGSSIKTTQKVPAIEHPILKQAKANAISSVNSGMIFDNNENGQRPVAFEDGVNYKMRSQSGMKNNYNDTQYGRDNTMSDGVFLTNIPENVAITSGDPHSTRLPIFGNRSNIQSRASLSSRCSSSLSKTSNMSKVSPDEVSNRFHKKLQSNYYEVRKRFLENDPEQKGNVTKEALMRIVQSTTGLHITKQILDSLLESWGMKTDKPVFNFSEINSAYFNKSKFENGDSFVDPVARQKSKTLEIVKMKSADVYKWLKNKLDSREIYLTDLFPESDNAREFQLTQSDLKETLNKQMIDLNNEEMDKLWLRLNPQKNSSISGMAFLKQLEVINKQKPGYKPSCKDSKAEITSPTSLEFLLKTKLREGYRTLGIEFQKYDKVGKGFVSPDDFLLILDNMGLHIEKTELTTFLNRCLVSACKEGIPYNDFLARFQDRSEAGITHRLLASDDKSASDELQMIQKKLVNIFQRDFLEILDNFRKHDKSQLGLISVNDFKDVIERKFNTKFSNSELQVMIDNLPLTKDSKIPYLDFLKQFDTGNLTPLMDVPVPDTNKSASNQIMSNKIEENSTKSVSDIKKTMKYCFDNRFGEIDAAFEEVDELNTNQLTEEMMYQLFKRLNTKPEITRGDIRSIWPTFILNDRKMLDYKELLRHFMYNKNTSSFPNSKLFPPVKGDSDLIKRSRKLNGTTDLVLDNLRSKIGIYQDQLMQEFVLLDTSGSGEISLDDFKEMLKELTIQINDYEMDCVCQKFSNPNNKNKINYRALLIPYNKGVLPEPKNEISKKQKNKNKSWNEKLKIIEKPSIKRALKKTDNNGNGHIQLEELRAILLTEGVSLSDDDCMEILARYDKQLIGCVDYKSMIQDLDVN